MTPRLLANFCEFLMGPKGKHPSTGDLFQQALTEPINAKHSLVKLAELIDWSVFEIRWSGFFPSRTGHPASSPRLITGLLHLQGNTPLPAPMVGMLSLPGKPYDGHTLPEAIEQVSILTHRTPKGVFVDKAYRGVSVDGLTIWRSGQRRGLTPSIRKAIH